MAFKLKEAVRTAGRRSIAKDAHVFRQGQIANALIVLDQAHLRVLQITSEGEQVILHYVSSGEVFWGSRLSEIKCKLNF